MSRTHDPETAESADDSTSTDTSSEQEGDFIASQSRRVHRGTLANGPHCGTAHTGNWAHVDAADAEEAVLDYNLMPCLRCIDDAYKLERWRKELHSAVVMHDVDPPEKWQAKYDSFYEGDGDETSEEGSA